MNIITKTAVLAAIVASLTVPLLMTSPATAGLLSPEELLAVATVKSFNYVKHDAERQWNGHYVHKKCVARYTKMGVSPASADRRCRRFR